MLRSDLARLEKFLTQLRDSRWIDASQKWWIPYVFHFTSLENTLAILKSGELLSRGELITRNQNFLDSSSQDIISHTKDEYRHCVRFYFRPLTPTLYYKEGFRPQSALAQQTSFPGAKCSVPVYLLFSKKAILTAENASFSAGSLASASSLTYNTIEAFEQLPFEQIYHNSGFSSDKRESIIYHRQAEVIVPNRVDLSTLQYIVCRSTAEQKTLLYQLGDTHRSHWQSKIIVPERQELYYRDWIYVARVEADKRALKIFWGGKGGRSPYQSTIHPLEFKITTGFKPLDSDQPPVESHQTQIIDVNKPFLCPTIDAPRYCFTLRLNDEIAFEGIYPEAADESPF